MIAHASGMKRNTLAVVFYRQSPESFVFSEKNLFPPGFKLEGNNRTDDP